jgi:hypothetical protein
VELLKGVGCTFTVKLVNSDPPLDPKKVAVVDRWSLFGGHLFNKNFKMGPENGGLYGQVVVIGKLSLAQV